MLAKKCKKVEALKKIAYEKQEEKVKNQGYQSKFLSIFSLKDILLTNRLHIRSEREKEKEKEEENIFELAKYSNTKVRIFLIQIFFFLKTKIKQIEKQISYLYLLQNLISHLIFFY